MFIAVRTGLEPATPGVTGPYSNQLNYRTSMSIFLVSTGALKSFSSTVSLIADAKIRKISLPPNFSSFFCTSSSLQVPVTSGGPESKKKGWNTHLFPSLLQLREDLLCRFVVHECKGQVSFAAQFPVHFEIGFREKYHSAAACELCCNFACVSRAYNVLEPDIVYPAVESRAAFQLVLYQQSAALCHYFALDYSRDDRVAREMASAEELIVPDCVFGVGYTLCIYFYLVHEQHRFAVRQIFF